MVKDAASCRSRTSCVTSCWVNLLPLANQLKPEGATEFGLDVTPSAVAPIGNRDDTMITQVRSALRALKFLIFSIFLPHCHTTCVCHTCLKSGLRQKIGQK